MNLRQKAKRYKKLYEEMSPRNPVPVMFRRIDAKKHYRAVRRFWDYPQAGEIEYHIEVENLMKREMVSEFSEVLMNSIKFNEEENMLELDVWV